MKKYLFKKLLYPQRRVLLIDKDPVVHCKVKEEEKDANELLKQLLASKNSL